MIINQVVSGGGGSAPASYRAFQKDANGKLVNSTSTPWIPLPSGTTDLDAYILYYAYKNTPANILSGALDLSSLTTLSGANAMSSCFYGCAGITSVNLSSLTTISAQEVCSSTFQDCTGITSVDVSSLTTISGYFACGYMFQGCTGLTSMVLSSLTSITGGQACRFMFAGCSNLTTLSFPALTSTSFGASSAFNNMLNGVTGCTVHFPSNLDPQNGSTVISSLTGYPNFGGTNTILAFDLPATE